MHITEIRIDRTKSLGNYENIKLGLTITKEETENDNDAIERAKRMIDWHINLEERTATFEKLSAKETLSDVEQQWLDKFNALKASI